MSFATWIAFVIAGTVIAISPGSGAVLSMSHGLAYGVRKASATVLGLQLGLILVLIIAGAGVGSLVLAHEGAFRVVKWTGAAYLVYLGVSQWFSKVATGPVASSAGLAAHPSFGKRVLTGFLTNATNPKGIIFMVAMLPQFISKDAPLLPQLLILGVTMVTIDSLVMHGYATLAASMQGLFRNPRAMRIQNRIFGTVLVAVGLTLVFVERGA
ncbi:LysE family transporter [Massilia sp. Dwa41.01b]|uniref:LysE family transporter n=1 Tax=unclassified Massilia TaxID=2609279 RepID=UPI001602A062|nr:MULTISPECIES: LysE family transporter [unclassified Massilia]QNA87305.1 LysE family transporter [Massilia sp. Dwa41.01b]QNA98209.1 LysE family transporter [Massilia sp. Se16.2.3]